jgi:hypothetical protein
MCATAVRYLLWMGCSKWQMVGGRTFDSPSGCPSRRCHRVGTPAPVGPPVRAARSAARASFRLLGSASAAGFGAPPARAPSRTSRAPLHLHLPAPHRCWCTHSVSKTCVAGRPRRPDSRPSAGPHRSAFYRGSRVLCLGVGSVQARLPSVMSSSSRAVARVSSWVFAATSSALRGCFGGP